MDCAKRLKLFMMVVVGLARCGADAIRPAELKEVLKVFLFHVNENKNLVEAAFSAAIVFMRAYIKAISARIIILG